MIFARNALLLLLGASLGLAAHGASAQSLNDVVNNLGGRLLAPQAPNAYPPQGYPNDAGRDAYERGRADAYRDQRAREDDERRRADEDRRFREDERRRADEDRRRYGDQRRYQSDLARQQADMDRARADEQRARDQSGQYYRGR